MTTRWLLPFALIGLFASAAAWALHQQAGIILASWSCDSAPAGVWASGAVAGLLLLFGATLSWFALRTLGKRSPDDGQPRRFLAVIGLMAAALFAFAIILQVSAVYFLPGCVG